MWGLLWLGFRVQRECSNVEMRHCAVRRAGFQECPCGNWCPQGYQQLDRYSEKSNFESQIIQRKDFPISCRDLVLGSCLYLQTDECLRKSVRPQLNKISWSASIGMHSLVKLALYIQVCGCVFWATHGNHFFYFFVLIIVMKIWSVIVPLRDNQHLINKSTLKVLKSTVSHMLVA